MDEFCDRCEHSIDFYRFNKKIKPKACIAIFKSEKDGGIYFKCDKYKEIGDKNE